MSIPGADAVDGSVLSVSRRAAACGVLQQMFDFSLLLSPTFVVICLSGVLPMIGQWSVVSGQWSVLPHLSPLHCLINSCPLSIVYKCLRVLSSYKL